MSNELQQTCRRLLEEGQVQVIIGYGQDDPDAPVHPVFITRPEDVQRLVWNNRCLQNLTTYLTRKEVKALGKCAVVVKGCDERSLTMLIMESQADWSEIVVIGVACEILADPPPAKCTTCEVQTPRLADITIGWANWKSSSSDERYAELDEFLQKTPAQRLEYWMAEFDRCVKCYACRQVCPLCYCERCIADKNRPTCIDTSASPKGNFAWHITRAFHLAGRCVGCDECTRACPAGIDLRLLNMALARVAEQSFGFRPGMDPEAEPIIGSYSEQDKESFIR